MLFRSLTGGSAGREGAAIQFGGSIGNQLGRIVHLGVSNIFYAQPVADIYASIVTIVCFIKIIPSYLKSHGVK